MAKKKDKDELEQVEGKAIKNAKSLQEKQREGEEKLQAELQESVKHYFSNMFKYLLVKDVLLLKVEEGVVLEHFEIVDVKDIKDRYEKENIGLIDNLFTIHNLVGLTPRDMRMLEGEDTDGKPFELDTDRVLLVKCVLPGFDRLRLVGTLRIPKGVNDVVCDYKEKYLNA